MTDRRVWIELKCWLCLAPAVWWAFENEDADDSYGIFTCEKHKTAAFS